MHRFMTLIVLIASFCLLMGASTFTATAQITFQTAQAGPVRLVVFDQLGREVATLVNGEMTAGRHAVSFQAAGPASGVYFARLSAGNQTSMIRMMLMK